MSANTTLHAIGAAALADLRQRVRSFRFVAVLMATVAVALLMLPRLDAGYTVLLLGGARGAYNAAWVGLVFGVVGGLVLPLFGFFLVKDAVTRDRETRVGLLLATTPLSRAGYLGAKFLSNLGVFVAILAVCSVMAFVMQWWRAEDRSFHPVDLLGHLWAVPLPMVLLTSAVALFFECVPGLRGAFGNVVFFFLWAGVLGPGMEHISHGQGGRIIERSADLFGIAEPLADFEDHLDVATRDHSMGLVIGADADAKPPRVVRWPGIANNSGWLAQRAAWSLAFVPLLLGAALFFDRFDPARGRRRAAPAAAAAPVADAESAAPAWRVLSALPGHAVRWRPFELLKTELTLLARRRAWWWYGVIGVLWIAGLANDAEAAVRWVVPLLWLWGITAYSELGARARIHGTLALLESAPAPLSRQLPVQWVAGIAFGLLLAGPVLAKLMLIGGAGLVAQILVGAAFLSALTLACGAATGSARLFELVFLALWYAQMQNVPGVGFAGRAGLTFAASDAPHLFAIAAALMAAAVAMRTATMRRS